MADAIDDISLLREYRDRGSQDAFTRVVERYVPLVYSTAVRQVRDKHLAEDVTQAVFLILAKKTGALPAKTVLGAWLWKVTRLTAMGAMRREKRLKQRERKAAAMAELTGKDAAKKDAAWSDIEPLLDEALADLGEKDRRAVVLRFFEGRNLREVGMAMDVSEDAAKQLLLRAIEKLRKSLAARGVTCASAAAVGVLIAENGVAQVPPGLVAASAATGITSGAVQISALAKGAMLIMAYTKAKTAAVVVLIMLLLGGSALLVINGLNQGGSTAQGHPQQSPTSSASATTAPDNWQQRFNAVYRLENGETLRRISPPFIPERSKFLSAMDPARRFAVDNAAYSFGWNGSINSVAGPMQAQTIASTLTYTLGVPSYRVELAPIRRAMRLSGDWIVRQGATDQEKLSALATILRRDWDLKLTFAAKQAEQIVFVAKGKWTVQAPDSSIDLFIKQRDKAQGTVEGTRAKLLQAVAELADAPMIDETEQAAAPMKWNYHDLSPGEAIGPDRVEQLLGNIAEQTGLLFERQKRPMTIWVGTIE